MYSLRLSKFGHLLLKNFNIRKEVILLIVIASFSCKYQVFGDSFGTDGLKKVFVVFRHGDRAPRVAETYPNDPYVHYYWPSGRGLLTKKGMLQLYKLGQRIRKEYGWMTDYKYFSVNTVVNSSFSDRCIMSTQSLLAGLYPPDDKNTFYPGLNWQPIPVHYVPKDLDKILVVKKKCPKLDNALKEAFHKSSLETDVKLKSYYEELSRITGKKIDNLASVELIYNNLEIHVTNNLPLPRAMEKFYRNSEIPMRKLAALSYNIFTSNKLQQRLRGGPLLKHILENMKYGSEHEKIHLYGTHDINVINTLRTMGFTDELFRVAFGVSLIFELRVNKAAKSQEVRISMLNNTEESTVPHRLHIPGCGDTCLLDDLFILWKDVIPNDWEKECEKAL